MKVVPSAPYVINYKDQVFMRILESGKVSRLILIRSRPAPMCWVEPSKN